MNYEVYLIKSDDGYAINCPALPGCWTQGHTKEEALNNIKDAIRLWLEVDQENSSKEQTEILKEVVTL